MLPPYEYSALTGHLRRIHYLS